MGHDAQRNFAKDVPKPELENEHENRSGGTVAPRVFTGSYVKAHSMISFSLPAARSLTLVS